MEAPVADTTIPGGEQGREGGLEINDRVCCPVVTAWKLSIAVTIKGRSPIKVRSHLLNVDAIPGPWYKAIQWHQKINSGPMATTVDRLVPWQPLLTG